MASSDDSPTTPPPPLTKPSAPPPLILLIYPATLLLGSLFSVLSPTAQPITSTSSSTPQQQSQPPSPKPQPINYFARKDNVFNLYFVKIGWIWLTLAFAAILLVHAIQRNGSATTRPRRLTQAGLRYVLVTLAWYFTTQWFFGPPIIDRSFVLTGGRCESILRRVASRDGVGVDMGESTTSDAKKFGVLFSAAACKAAGGAWRGGHDVSGHVFMLVLVTAVLGFESWGVVGEYLGGRKERKKEEEEDVVRVWALRFVAVVIGLSWWMLLMTAIWFHTWLEKWNGLIISLATVYVLYLLPRRLTAWRNIVGIPGV